MIFLILTAIPVFSEAFGHSMFNSAESTFGGYRVQVATLPEFPEIGENSQILFDAIPPKSYEGAHVEMDHVWENSGNHIVRVDLYDMEGTSKVLTYTFNMGTQSPFGYIFFIAIIIGALTLGVVVTYIYFPEKLKFKTSS
jgi:hypothetical protein